MRRFSAPVRLLTVGLLVLSMLVSMAVCAMAMDAEGEDTPAELGATMYYLYGVNSNDPDFGAMSAPTGTFSYDSARGYYYYDIKGAGGDYCFVVSTVANSGANAVSNPAVTSIANAGSYYLSAGNYHGYACMHLWNPSGDDVRVYFTTPAAGLYAVALSAAESTTATTAPATAAPTSPQPATSATSSSGSSVVYCENAAGWSVVSAYLWNGENNNGWPGATMTNVGGNIWRLEFTGSYVNIIFSARGANQTADLTLPGSGYIYNNQTGEWSIYDTSPLQVSAFATDLSSPQYNGTAIVLSATASGVGTVMYKFSATNLGTNVTTVLGGYSTRNYATWTPQSIGSYTLTYDFIDAAGNKNQRTQTYRIESGLTVTSPYIRSVTPARGQIQRGASCAVTVAASGGITGTNLLFYKYTVKNPSGTTVNTPYYSRSASFSFTPTVIGTYTLTVSVQASDNTVATRTYTLSCVNTVTPDDDSTLATEYRPDGTLKGDADVDGDVSITDATIIQMWLAHLIGNTSINLTNADVDADGDVSITDATLIQQYLAHLIPSL